jgi:hypothetical protein
MLKSRDWREWRYWRQRYSSIYRAGCRTCCIPRCRRSDEGCRAGCAATVLACCRVGRLQAPSLALLPRGFTSDAAHNSSRSRIRRRAFVCAPRASVPENARGTVASAKNSTIDVVFIDRVVLNESIQVNAATFFDGVSVQPPSQPRRVVSQAVVVQPGHVDMLFGAESIRVTTT